MNKKSGCPYQYVEIKTFEEPLFISGRRVEKIPITKCSHKDQKENEGCIITNKGKLYKNNNCKSYKEKVKD